MITLAHTSPDQTAQLSDNIDTVIEQLNQLTKTVSSLTALDIAQFGTANYGNGGATFVGPGPVLLGDIQHGLGYVPTCKVWVQAGSGGNYFPVPYTNIFTGTGGTNGKVAVALKAIVDNQNLSFWIYFGWAGSVSAPTGGWNFRYYIFRAPMS